jgi:hypothetical protein
MWTGQRRNGMEWTGNGGGEGPKRGDGVETTRRRRSGLEEGRMDLTEGV